MSVSSFATLIFLNLVGALSPGPDVILITRLATKSRRHAIAATAGIQVGVLFWCTLTVLGAAALLNTFPQVLGGIQIVGGLWLAWMGSKIFRGGMETRKNPPADLAEGEAQLGRLRHTFALGLATNLANPKIVLFLSALIAPMLPAYPSWLLAIGLILSLSLSAFLMFVGICFIVSTKRMRRCFLSLGPWIDIAAGTFFFIAGLLLVTNGIASFF